MADDTHGGGTVRLKRSTPMINARIARTVAARDPWVAETTRNDAHDVEVNAGAGAEGRRARRRATAAADRYRRAAGGRLTPSGELADGAVRHLAAHPARSVPHPGVRA